MTLTAAHKVGSHDEQLVTGCRVCDDILAFFLQYGDTMPPELVAKAIEEAEFDEAPGEDWEEDEEGYAIVRLDMMNVEGDPTRNGAFG